MCEDTGNPPSKRPKWYEQKPTASFMDAVLDTDKWRSTRLPVHGTTDKDHCTYDLGYLKRQAVFSCLTCHPADADPYEAGGMCYACSLSCHQGHQVEELFTKRNFRCDCGNMKYPNNLCSLQPNKSDYNLDNKYNQNYKGVYCHCHRPYPDPENDQEEEMIQCLVCEDWFHHEHTYNKIVAQDINPRMLTSDFICKACTKKCDFLSFYGKKLVNAKTADSSDDDEELESRMESQDGGMASANSESVAGLSACQDGTLHVKNELGTIDIKTESCSVKIKVKTELKTAIKSEVKTEIKSEVKTEIKRELKAELKNEVKVEVKNEPGTSNDDIEAESRNTRNSVSPVCRLANQRANRKILSSGGTLWMCKWYKELCKCDNCLEKYHNLGASFLVDYDDTMLAYHGVPENFKDCEIWN